MKTHSRRSTATIAALATLLGTTVARADNPIDSLMERSPTLAVPRIVKVFPKRLGEALIEALDRPEIETTCAAAQSIALAHRDGLPGLSAATNSLIRELDRSDQHPTVRLAVAHALIALDAKQAADSLFRQLASDDPELRELVEPALGKWDYQPVRTLWLERLAQAPPHRRRHLIAIRELGTVKEEKAAPALRALVLNRTVPSPVRLEAARSLAIIRKMSLETDAQGLSADVSLERATDRLVAASLLRHHQGDEAVRLLQSLGRDADPMVAAVALARLVEIDTKLVVPLLEPVLGSADANVRSFGVEVLFRQPNESHFRLLGVRLSDPHPDVRSKARMALFELAKRAEFRSPIVEEGMKVLAARDWRGQEQAAVLLAQLDHKAATTRLLERLVVDRPEAFIAAAWALRQLAVPNTLAPVFKFVGEHHQKLLASGPTAGRRGISGEAIDRQLTQLVQFLGQARYAPADAILREMLPRIVRGQPGNPRQTPVGAATRAAVAWALGMIHEGKPEPKLIQALEARLTDVPTPLGGEGTLVRTMAAISIGRMKARDAVGTLRRFYPDGKPTFDSINNACGWAIEQITGEVMPPAGTVTEPQVGWFITRMD